jgi:hypothetical protein
MRLRLTALMLLAKCFFMRLSQPNYTVNQRGFDIHKLTNDPTEKINVQGNMHKCNEQIHSFSTLPRMCCYPLINNCNASIFVLVKNLLSWLESHYFEFLQFGFQLLEFCNKQQHSYMRCSYVNREYASYQESSV